MADADYAKEVIEFENFVGLQVLLDGSVEDVCRPAVRAEEIAFELSFSDALVLVEGQREAVVLLLDLFHHFPALVAQLLEEQFRLLQLPFVPPFVAFELLGLEVGLPGVAFVFLGVDGGGEFAEEFAVQNYVILHDVVREHQSVQRIHVLLD